MSKYSWNNPDLQLICGQCHFKDENPELCHAVEPPMKKKFIPDNVSSCSFVRESHWQRMTKERQNEIIEYVKMRSNKFYS